MIIVLRILFFSLGICGLISFVAIFVNGITLIKLVSFLTSFLIMIFSFFISLTISREMVEWVFNHEQSMSRGRKFFLRLCVFVIGGVAMALFAIKLSTEKVTLESLINVASILVTALFFLYCAVSGKFPADFIESIWKKR